MKQMSLVLTILILIGANVAHAATPLAWSSGEIYLLYWRADLSKNESAAIRLWRRKECGDQVDFRIDYKGLQADGKHLYSTYHDFTSKKSGTQYWCGAGQGKSASTTLNVPIAHSKAGIVISFEGSRVTDDPVAGVKVDQ